jgi:hypothetical protein
MVLQALPYWLLSLWLGEELRLLPGPRDGARCRPLVQLSAREAGADALFR